MFLKLFVIVTAVGLASTEEANPVVTINQGVLEGTWKTSWKNRTFASFEGIPYAQPPVGDYRFKPPQELTSWNGTWNATEPLSACMQFDPFTLSVTGSEDCLYANVYTPNINSDALLPVMVFIHGGAFMYGAGSLYAPFYLMDSNLILVTFNYRLGPLGFLSTEDGVIPGNYGLKDQSFLLHWVKNNIAMFGGDPDSITLTGCSAGGASVHYHYLSPLSRDTFNQGIAFSGSALSPWSHTINPAQKAKTLASLVGCSIETSEEILVCLKNSSAEDIVYAQSAMFGWKVPLFTPFTPTKEPSCVEDAFITKHPYQATVDGDMMNVPLIVSDDEQEGLYPSAAYQTDPSILEELNSNWEELASDIFQYNETLPEDQRSEVAAKIKEHYFGDKDISENTFPQLVKALSDRLFFFGVGLLAELHACISGQPTYVYLFKYHATISLSNILANNTVDYGVCHIDDVLHLFNYPSIEAVTEEDYLMIENLGKLIYNYVATGVPVMPGSDAEWLPVDPSSSGIDYLEISSPTTAEMKVSTDYGERSFWSSLELNENENYSDDVTDE